MADVKYWIWLTHTCGLSGAAAQKYLDYFGSAKKIYFASGEELALVPGAKSIELKRLANRQLEAAEKIEADCRSLGVRIMTLRDADYPDRLRNIYDAPTVLYVRGELPVIDDSPCIAIVGTRRAGDYGRRCARSFGRDICLSGGVVVSGLAEGIDSAAMLGALDAGGPAIGVLGTGIDMAYPAWNAELHSRVAACGALISEYPPGVKGSRISFPRRNRIISGISLGVIVIEAPEKSGSLITASRASEQGRDVYVVPGNIDDPNFVGSNLLIRDGAALAMNAWEVISCYRWMYPERICRPGEAPEPPLEPVIPPEFRKNAAAENKKAVDKQKNMEYIDMKDSAQLPEDELALIRALSGGARRADELIELSGLEAGDVLAAITLLELEGIIRLNGEQRFELCR